MGFIRLELPCPKEVNGISIDPNPNWNFNDLLSELKLNSYDNASVDPSLNPKPFIKTSFRELPRVGRLEKNEEKKRAFSMRVHDDVDDDEERDVFNGKGEKLVPASRFGCNDIYLSESDSSDDEEMQQRQVTVMDKIGVVENAFLELTHEHQLGIKEEIRNQLSAVEMQLMAEKEKSATALVQVEKSTDARRQMDKKQDLYYQRKIAEALDNHLTTIQRDHEHRSQIEERRIRDDAAVEEAKRKEKALQEEKLRQQKAKEEEIRREAARRAEYERKMAEEAERLRKTAQEAERLTKETAEKLAKDNSAKDSASAQTGNNLTSESSTSAPNVPKEMKSGGLLRAAENALKLEERRCQIYKELQERNQSIISASNMDLRPKDREIGRRIRQVSGSLDSVRSKVTALVKMFNDPSLPQSITVEIFVKKVISTFETSNPDATTFACAHVIVYVSAQVPVVMDCLLAEFHKACIYTVPKHIIYSKTSFEKPAYLKAIGYQEQNGEIESKDSYLERVKCLMKLYGALVQTEAEGVQNVHGLEEGWAWLARFLNRLPPNKYTAVALEAFLRMAGFALHRKYGLQFRKILNVISKEFVPALSAHEDASVMINLRDYIDSQEFLKEPAGWRLEATVLSKDSIPEVDRPQEQYYHTQPRRFTYQR
ncbi:unnamed protein product [Amaranthus hypochondriacus]